MLLNKRGEGLFGIPWYFILSMLLVLALGYVGYLVISGKVSTLLSLK